jgi:hypothetical protein
MIVPLGQVARLPVTNIAAAGHSSSLIFAKCLQKLGAPEMGLQAENQIVDRGGLPLGLASAGAFFSYLSSDDRPNHDLAAVVEGLPISLPASNPSEGSAMRATWTNCKAISGNDRKRLALALT